MRGVSPIVTLIAVLLLLVARSVPAAAENDTPFVLRLATMAPVHAPFCEQLQQMKGEILRRTEGRMKVLLYAGGVMGDELDVARKIALGQLHGAVFASQGIAHMAPEMQVFNLPYLYRTPEEAEHVRDVFMPRARRILEGHALELLGWGHMGGFVLLYSAKPLRTFSEIQAARVWAWADDPLSIEATTAMSLNPVLLPATEVFPAAQSGLIDAMYGTSMVVLRLNWYRFVNYALRINASYPQYLLFVTQNAWKGIRPQDQEYLRAMFQDLARSSMESARAENQTAEKALAKRGMTFLSPDPELMEALTARAPGLWEKLAGTLYPRELLNEILTALDRFRTSAPPPATANTLSRPLPR